MYAGGTTPWMGEVERSRRPEPRATQGAVAEDPHPPECERAGTRRHPASAGPRTPAARVVRRDGLTPRKPSLGRAVSGAAMALAGRLHRNDLDDHPANPSSGAKRCSTATPLFRSSARRPLRRVHTRTSADRIGALCFLVCFSAPGIVMIEGAGVGGTYASFGLVWAPTRIALVPTPHR